MKDFNRYTAWVDKVLNGEVKQECEIAMKFAEEAQKRLGRAKHE
jgi:hypothetical protein